MKFAWASVLWLLGMANFVFAIVNIIYSITEPCVWNILTFPFNAAVAIYCFTGITSMYAD